jgi:hypothetical protein
MSAAVARSAARRTAAGSTTRRSSCRSRRNSRVRPALLCQATTSGSNQFHCSPGSTRVPSLGPVTSRPLATSDLTASRTTVRLTPSVLAQHGLGRDRRATAGSARDDGLAQQVERVAVHVLDHGGRQCGNVPVSGSHEGGDQRIGTDLAAPVAVHCGVEGGARRQGVGREEVLARPEDPAAAVLQADLHLPAEDEHPLRRRCSGSRCESPPGCGAAAAAAGHQRRQRACRLAFGQRDGCSRKRARPSVSVKRMTWVNWAGMGVGRQVVVETRNCASASATTWPVGGLMSSVMAASSAAGGSSVASWLSSRLGGM